MRNVAAGRAGGVDELARRLARVYTYLYLVYLYAFFSIPSI